MFKFDLSKKPSILDFSIENIGKKNYTSVM